MAINTHGSNIRTETNLQGQMVDNDELVAARAAYEHHHHPTEPWQRGYKEPVREVTLTDTVEVLTDDTITEANKANLKKLGIHIN